MHKTGKGKIAGDATYLPCNVLLYNFDIEGAALKREHKDWLSANVVSKLRSNAGSVLLIGSASRTGGGFDNFVLSFQRVLAVKEYLESFKPFVKPLPRDPAELAD